MVRTCGTSDQGGPRAILMIVVRRPSNPVRAILIRKDIVKGSPVRKEICKNSVA
ncbi:hypothetical protein ALC57_15850 [Trachymyrmex cornetzi]|uniref:Uncharacterized protein n=1 Tax=Trachymyrmex cornetzi TaxID=471704 RepID=A0A151IW02_9HYME|nr:hypothetical protein ALC57_15850 [Trachymyrmex cornetzi]